ncbi:putative Ribonuclease p complex subunit [Seiridium cardinale]|uniref:Ribonuclease p complex subunit n=1 Tax=Seiridium cardinale TaxID=138064 RepID=A0ABR2Y0S7_9PEZI
MPLQSSCGASFLGELRHQWWLCHIAKPKHLLGPRSSPCRITNTDSRVLCVRSFSALEQLLNPPAPTRIACDFHTDDKSSTYIPAHPATSLLLEGVCCLVGKVIFIPPRDNSPPPPAMCLIFTCGEHTFRKEVEGYEGVVCQCHNCGNWSGRVIKSNPWFTFCFVAGKGLRKAGKVSKVKAGNLKDNSLCDMVNTCGYGMTPREAGENGSPQQPWETVRPGS